MKKIITLLITFIMTVSSINFVYAKDEEINVYLEDFSGIDGEKINFDIQPQTVNGRTMVPIRAIFEAMGATVNWDDSTKTAVCTKDNTVVKMTLNSTIEYINDVPYTMDVTPVIISGRTLAPARYVAEAFGYNVKWDEMTRTVLISKNPNYGTSDIVDGSRKHPYKLGDKANINVLESYSNESAAIFEITPKKVLSPEEMEKKINNSTYYKYDENTWYLNCDVSLKYYKDDSAYSFGINNNFVTSKGTIQTAYSWYKDPSTYSWFELFESDSSECYIPIKTNGMSDGETIDYFTITTYDGYENYESKKKTIWFYLK